MKYLLFQGSSRRPSAPVSLRRFDLLSHIAWTQFTEKKAIVHSLIYIAPMISPTINPFVPFDHYMQVYPIKGYNFSIAK